MWKKWIMNEQFSILSKTRSTIAFQTFYFNQRTAMKVFIDTPVGYSELGTRANNEDALFPAPDRVSAEQQWFLVCDGVGGLEKGEIASSMAVEFFDVYFRMNPISIATEPYIQQAVSFVEDHFNSYLENNPTAAGMATTVTLLYLHQAGATVAHIGDSRVYFIREGRIQWCTDDHSYVNDLVKGGMLTRKQASVHPKRNVITRALQGGDRPVLASVQIINDLREGDCFFLCSDGVLERISDELIENTLSEPGTGQQKMEILRQLSIGGMTKDNFTAYLIEIKQVSGKLEIPDLIPLSPYIRTEPENDGSIVIIEE